MARRVHSATIDLMSTVAERSTLDAPLPHPPILVVGPPRSGTTLLDQVIVSGLDVGWFSGWHNVLAGAPGLVPARLQNEPASHFSSDHGRVGSWREPHEAATWWYRFFPRELHAVGVDQVDPTALAALRRSTRSVLKRADRPVVWKNVVNSVRLDAVLTALPEAIVVVAHRDIDETARSIFRAREHEAGSVDAWWSVEPANIEGLRRLEPDAQVRGQIESVRSAIESSRTANPDTAFVDVDYRDLVGSPRVVVDEVGAAIEAATGRNRRRAEHHVPERFSRPAQSAS